MIKKTKRALVLLLAIATLLTFAACGETSSSGSSAPPPTSEVTTPDTRIVNGDGGEAVEIPYTIVKAAPLIGALAQMTEMLTNGGGKICAAATNNISDYFKEVFPDYVESNPSDYDSSSVEDLIAAGCQVCYGPSSIFSEDQIAQLESAGIAYVPINNLRNVSELSNAFLIVGEILGERESARAKEFVDYYKGNLDKARELTEGVADGDKIRVLSAFYSADAYNTINGNDICNEYIEAAGGINVAKDYSPEGASNSLIVDAEQIVAWNPQFIMTSNQSGKEAVLNDPALATVDAVKNGNVGVCPYGVYLWSVRSGEGSMLPLWLGTQMYPDLFEEINMETVVKDFFNYWYGYDITAEEIQNTLAGDASTGMTR